MIYLNPYHQNNKNCAKWLKPEKLAEWQQDKRSLVNEFLLRAAAHQNWVLVEWFLEKWTKKWDYDTKATLTLKLDIKEFEQIMCFGAPGSTIKLLFMKDSHEMQDKSKCIVAVYDLVQRGVSQEVLDLLGPKNGENLHWRAYRICEPTHEENYAQILVISSYNIVTTSVSDIYNSLSSQVYQTYKRRCFLMSLLNR